MSPFSNRNKDDIPIGEIPAPDGPVLSSGDSAQANLASAYASEYERQIFRQLTQPDDSYTADGVYWADLPLGKRLKFVNEVDKAEAKSECRNLWAMIKEDPLSPLSWYWQNAILPGAGLGLEGYVLFSIGNLEPLFAAVWPQCWGKNPTECSKNWTASVTYLEVVGIMVGQVVVGIMGDWIGRRWGLIQDALIMLLGLIMLTAAWGTSLENWVILYGWCLFIYGLGVGGEYPITATASMENAVASGKLSTREDRLHRGRKVTLAFLMQGWGQFVNQVLLIILLVIFNRGSGAPPYLESAAQYTLRISFGIPALGTLWLAYYRTWKIKHASKHLDKAKKKANVTGYDVKSMKLTLSHFGGRLLATAGTWFCNDVFFYGNKLFQGQFISVIADNPDSVVTKWTWNLINVVVSLAGYYCASMLIDHKLYGRKLMQQVGFAMCFIMFVIPAFNYKYYTSPAGVHAFQAMYFLSSFFNQFGPNSVTFLVAGEVFPTQIRASAHGFSAMIGKAGALLASVLYNYIDTQTKFYVVPWFGLAGMLMTWLWLPDTTGLDLKEQERRWQYILDGRAEQYHGIAIHPTHLSVWERWTGVGRSYHPDLDVKAKIRDLRADWEEREATRGTDEAGPVDLDDDYTEDIDNYFRGTTSGKGPVLSEKKGKANSSDGSVEQEKLFVSKEEQSQ
ncbi:major facilitator superfamily domain-containing protein [Microdochium trichocladiopsis]|uniref:Major facilitator superfamily domain-containing protein n=1 Tax=Microdochium trichocladiopsis TaxID=1682393 RepID=A0A9P8YDI8_9PEZI|nr:major facilitator superfamily domain-containing protein [Microdochium trichocladiopsis]KAH7034976.1 major facilitator superfamily domain-containing protein [Microdochium trichocladiopsis]